MSSKETPNPNIDYDKKEYRDIGSERLIRFLELTDAKSALETPDDRVKFLLGQSEAEFHTWLLRINGFMRDTPTKRNEYDGYSVEAMTLLPPEYEDKQDLLNDCYTAMQTLLGQYQHEKDQDIKDDILLNTALMAQSAIVLIHPFANGNGRTSRVVGELILSGYDGSDKTKQMLANNVSKDKMTLPNMVNLRRGRDHSNIVNVFTETCQVRAFDNDITIGHGDYMANEEYEQVSDDLKHELSDDEKNRLRHTTRSNFLRLAEHILSNENANVHTKYHAQGEEFSDIDGINMLSKDEVVELTVIESGIRKTFLQTFFRQMSDVDSRTSQLMRGDFKEVYPLYLETALK